MTGAKPKKKGRPSLYTEPLAAKICRRLAEGESLRGICADKAMPAIRAPRSGLRGRIEEASQTRSC